MNQVAAHGMQRFSCAELGPLLEKFFPFGDARISALRVLAPSLADAATGSAAVLSAFKFDGERQEAGSIIVAASRSGMGGMGGGGGGGMGMGMGMGMGGMGSGMGGGAMGRAGLAEAIAARLGSEHFDEGRLAAVSQTVGMGGWARIPCAAAAPLLDKFPFGEARLSALQHLAPHLADAPTGQAAILGCFRFEGERKQAGTILMAAPPPAPAPATSYNPGGAQPMGFPAQQQQQQQPMGHPQPFPQQQQQQAFGGAPWGDPSAQMGAAMSGAMGAMAGAMGAMNAMAGFAAGMGAPGGFAQPPGAYPAPSYAPGYPAPGYPAPGFAPGYPAPGYPAPGFAPGMPGAPGGGMINAPGMNAMPMPGMGMPQPGWGAPR